MRKWICGLGLLFLPCLAHGQGIPYAVSPPAPSAQISVCSAPATGSPCTNQSAAYFDAAKTQLISQPFTISPTGNLLIYLSAGTYTIQITGRQDQIISLGSSGGGSPGGTNGQIQYNNAGAFGGISVLSAGNGGTTFASYTKGDLLCPSGTTTFTKLGVGSDGQVLTADAASSCGLKYAVGSNGLSGLSANCLPKAATSTTITGCSLASDNGTTLTYSGTGGVSAPKLISSGSGAGATVLTAGTTQGHATASTVTRQAPTSVTAYDISEATAAGTGCFYGTNTSSSVATTFSACPIVVWSGTVALNTAAISSASHNLTTANHSGILTTDFVSCVPNGSLNAVTGYVPSTSGTLGFYAYPTADNLNIDVINNTTGSITPGAVTLNCAVTR